MLIFTPTLMTNNFMTRLWILEPLNADTSSGPNCEPVVHGKRHDHEPRQTQCYGFRDH